jgi:hypothetical protein
VELVNQAVRQQIALERLAAEDENVATFQLLECDDCLMGIGAVGDMRAVVPGR